VAHRKPTVAGFLLGLATGTVFFPMFILPAWLSFYGRQGAGRCALACLLTVAFCLVGVAVILWSDGEWPRSLQSILSLSEWQPWSEPPAGTQGFWTGTSWVYRLPVFIAFFAFVIVTAFWPTPKNLGHVMALTTAVLIGIQFWWADQGGIHIFWYLPMLLLLIFRPNLADRFPPTIQPESDWLRKLNSQLGRFTLWLLNLPNPPVQVG
jgi:hypothetical protein